MEIYDTEEEQVEALKRWWKENGTSTLIGVALALAMIFGWNYWQNHKAQQALQASALYDQLLKIDNKEQYADIEKIAFQLEQKYSDTAYADFAQLFLAESQVRQEQLDQAEKTLDKLMKSADVEIANLARIRLVRIKLATEKYEEGLQLIAKVDPSSVEGFSALYDELTGDLYVALERLAEARTAYKSALRAGSSSPFLQFKLDDITAADVVVAEAE